MDFGQKNLKIKIFQNKIICIYLKAITIGSHLKQKLGLYDHYWVQNDFLSTVRLKHPSYLEIYPNYNYNKSNCHINITTININHYIRRKQINQPSLIYITLFTVQMRPNKLYIPGYVLIRRFSHLLNFFLGSKKFFLQNC